MNFKYYFFEDFYAFFEKTYHCEPMQQFKFQLVLVIFWYSHSELKALDISKFFQRKKFQIFQFINPGNPLAASIFHYRL